MLIDLQTSKFYVRLVEATLEPSFQTKKIRTSILSISDGTAVKVLNITRMDVAFDNADGRNEEKIRSDEKFDGLSWSAWKQTLVNEEELLRLGDRIVVFLEFEVLCGLRQEETDANTGYRSVVDSRRR